MVQKYTIALFFFLSFFGVYLESSAQDSTSVSPFTKKQGATISFLEYSYETGAYEEVIKVTTKYAKKPSNDPLYYSAQITSLCALSHYAMLHTEKAEQLLTDFGSKIVACQNKDEAALSWLALTNYYEQTSNIVKADSLIKKAEQLNATSIISQNELLWHKSIVLLQKGFYEDALNGILKLESNIKNNSTSLKRFSDEKTENLFSIKYTAELEIAKSLCFENKGKYDQSDSLLLNTNSKIKALTPAIKAKIKGIRAEIMLLKKNYNNSSDLFLQAYSSSEIRETEKNKLYYLCGAIEGFYRSGRGVESQGYLRRLQMLAFQSVGKREDVQIAYEYAESFRLYSEGNEKAAEKRLTALLETYSYLPDIHVFKFKARTLLSELYEKTGNVNKLFESEMSIATIREKYYGVSSIVYHKAKLALAMFEIKYGKRFAYATEIMMTSYDKCVSKQIDASSPENIAYLNAYADLYKKKDKLDSASYRYSLVVEISKQNFGEKSDRYLLALANYGDALIAQGKYKEGLEILSKLTSEIGTTKLSEVEVQQKIYLILGKLNKLIGEYDKSKSMYNEALELDGRNKYNDFLLQAETAEQQALLYFQTNNFYRAERALNKAYSLKKENLPLGNPLFYNPINAFASLKLYMGDLDAVEGYLKEASAIAKDVYGNESLMGIDTKLLYGDFNFSIGDYKKAEIYYLEVDQLVVKKLGAKHLKHAEILLQLISLRLKIPSYKRSDIEKLYVEALNVVKDALGTSNPLYMGIIQNQAKYFISVNKEVDAEKLLVEAEKYWKAKLGTENKYIANIYELRGDIAYQLSKYSDAENQFDKAKDIYKSVFSENHSEYNIIYAKLARVHYMNKNTDKAISIMDNIIPKYLDFTVKYFPSMSFRQKQEYWKSIKDEFEFYNTLAFNSKKNSTEMLGKAYNNTLATKAILLSSSMKILNQVMSSEDTLLISLYHDWVSKKEYLLTILNLSKQQLTEQGIDRNKVEDEISHLEKEMSLRSALFANEDKKKKLPKWENVKEVLFDGEYAVEIIRYRKFNKIFTDSVYYAALVINRGSIAPKLILNNNGINMERRNLTYYKNTTVTNVDDEYSYGVYWQRIKDVIPDGTVVYVSGDGVYNQLNIEMLRRGQGVYALDENRFVFVSNTKDLLQMEVPKGKKQKETKKENIVEYMLCGNPDFYSADSKISNKKINPLPGSEKEVRLINDLLVTSGKQPLVCYNSVLTEDTIKMIKNPRVIHIATHGYFKESTQVEGDELAGNPLLNSGILLYSAGDILDNPDNKYINQKNGVLTAYEAMNLTLDNTELVILSACETGKGEVQVGEGVAGLQRSFLLAGSKAIIVSLFKVNDEVTQKLMLLFYENWLKTNDKRSAFAIAKLKIKEQYKSPIFWGSFIMIEGRPNRTTINRNN